MKSEIKTSTMSDTAFCSDHFYYKASFELKETNRAFEEGKIFSLIDELCQSYDKITDKNRYDPYFKADEYLTWNLYKQLKKLRQKENPERYDYGVVFTLRGRKFTSFFIGQNCLIKEIDWDKGETPDKLVSACARLISEEARDSDQERCKDMLIQVGGSLTNS